jgi:plastocyanin
MLLRRLGMRSSTLLIAASLLMIACSDKSSNSAGANRQSVLPSTQAQTPGKTVTISQFKFRPEVVTLNPGDTVEWKNVDAVPHKVASPDGKTISSGNIEKHGQWKFKADSEGIYEYQCAIHPSMKARLIVQSPEAASAAKPSAAHAALARSR